MKIDRLDVDQMARMRESEVWQDYERRIRERYEQVARTCLNAASDKKAIRLAQGEHKALSFVLELPRVMQKEVVRKSDATNRGTSQSSADDRGEQKDGTDRSRA
jgi:hypothetical protein